MVTPNALPAIFSAGAVLFAGVAVLALVELEPLSLHMVQHIALMSVVAPLVAVALARNPRAEGALGRQLWAATLIQMMLLWLWHAPSLQQAAVHSGLLQAAVHGSLFLAAVFFWTALLRLPLRARWQGIAALLVTGKLACLLAALLVFAPRLLYAGTHAHHATITLSDQQLAGLLMITACPLSYVLAGIVLAARALSDLRMMGAAEGREAAHAR